MATETNHDRLIGTVSMLLDRMVHLRLTTVEVSRPAIIDRSPSDPVEFWRESAVQAPRACADHQGVGVARGPEVAGARARRRQRGTRNSLGQPPADRHGPCPPHIGTGAVRAPAAWLRGPADDVRSLARTPDAPAGSPHRAPRPSVSPAPNRAGRREAAMGTSASTRRISERSSGSRSRTPRRSSRGHGRRSRRPSSWSG